MPIQLFNESDQRKQARAVFLSLRDEILAILPGAKVEEIGSTSIPGALTKGDVDLLVQADSSNFDSTVEPISRLYQVNEGMEGTPFFASFKGVRNEIDFGVQVGGDDSFDFIAFRNALRASPSLLAEYNSLKLASKDLAMKAYREKKQLFIERVLSRQA